MVVKSKFTKNSKFIKSKKGSDITLKQVVLMVFAVALILVVTGFGAKIWSSFFPSGDKSSVKSFDSIYSVISTPPLVKDQYYSTSMGIYVEKNHYIVFFPNTNDDLYDCTSEYQATTSKRYYKPKVCNGKQCICLYLDKPVGTSEGREKNVVRCHTFDQIWSVTAKQFALNDKACSDKDILNYGSYLMVKHSDSKTEMNNLLILDDTPENRLYVKDISRHICNDPSKVDESKLCLNKKDGDVLKPSTFEEFTAIHNACLWDGDSISAKCVYDTASSICKLDCSDKESTKCNFDYKQCKDYNDIPSYGFEFINKDYSAGHYYMCTSPEYFCNFDCAIEPVMVYPSKCGWDADILGTRENDAKEIISCDPNAYSEIRAKCDFKYSTVLPANRYIVSYNTKDKDCTKFMDDNFYSQIKVLSCKPGSETSCAAFIKSNVDGTKNCGIRFLQEGSRFVLLSYDTRPQGCTTLKDWFIEADYCTAKAQS
jgi:hypothetical protein